MNAIAKIESAPNSKTVSTAASAQLWDLLTSERGGSLAAVDDILRTPGMYEEVRQLAPLIDAAMAPAGEAYVGAKLSEWSIVYDPGARAESPSFWAPYKRALADLPPEAILGAMRAWERNPAAEFLPKPGPMRDMAVKEIGDLYMAASRSRMTLKAWVRRVREFAGPQAYWNSDWGPRPGSPECRAPEDVLVEFGFDRSAA